MNCYNHNEKVGVAVCVNCGAVSCVDCVKKTIANKIVCSEKCAEASKSKDSLIDLVASNTRNTTIVTVWFFWLGGTVLLVYGLTQFPKFLLFSFFCFALGALFIGIGIRLKITTN